jgi:hypothetical protein
MHAQGECAEGLQGIKVHAKAKIDINQQALKIKSIFIE